MVKTEMSLRVPAGCRPGSERKGQSGYTDSVEEYIEGIFRLQAEVDLVSTGEVAAYMSVSAGSATTMIKKLADLGLAYHEPYQGIRLSPSGERIAKRLIRAHRIIEAFLVKTLNLEWHEVHDVACKLEHYVSDAVVDRMYEASGRPKICPHGSPIDIEAAGDGFRLKDAEPGDTVVVNRVTDERTEFLSYLSSIGLNLKAKVKVDSVSPIDSLINLEVDGKKVAVGLEVSRHVWVTLA